MSSHILFFLLYYKKMYQEDTGVLFPRCFVPWCLTLPITNAGRESSTREPENRHKKMHKEPVLMQIFLVTVITLIKRKAAHRGLVTGDAL